MFECVRREKRRDLIALGGRQVHSDTKGYRMYVTNHSRSSRYDDLLQRFSLPIARREGTKSYGVGVSILVE